MSLFGSMSIWYNDSVKYYETTQSACPMGGRFLHMVGDRMNEPVCEFKSEAEAVKYLKEWQERLFLNDWIIKLNRVTRVEMPQNCGLNEFQVENKCAVITLIVPDDDVRDRIVKYCEEKILVHELLHCKYNTLQNADTYEGKYVDVTEHMLLEQMAKSLIMAKYNIGADWFKNF